MAKNKGNKEVVDELADDADVVDTDVQAEEPDTDEEEEQVVDKKARKRDKADKPDKDNKDAARDDRRQNGKDNKKKDKKKEKGKTRRKIKDFFSELKKVTWPSFTKVLKQTGVVLVVTLIFLLVMMLFDYAFGWMYKALIGGLGGNVVQAAVTVVRTITFGGGLL